MEWIRVCERRFFRLATPDSYLRPNQFLCVSVNPIHSNRVLFNSLLICTGAQGPSLLSRTGITSKRINLANCAWGLKPKSRLLSANYTQMAARIWGLFCFFGWHWGPWELWDSSSLSDWLNRLAVENFGHLAAYLPVRSPHTMFARKPTQLADVTIGALTFGESKIRTL